MFEEHAITALTDIGPLVDTFADDAGWTVTGTSANPILTRAGGGMSFRLDAAVTGYDYTLSWNDTGATATSNARFVSPKLNGTSSVPVVSVPSKVYLFGNEDFIAIVVEYGFNSYRHLYLGNMEKAGSYTGGEVIGGCTPATGSASHHFPIDYRDHSYLFEAQQRVHASGNCGGVHVVHADNPTPWRRFRGANDTTVMDSFDNTCALGGFGDDVNDGYIARGRSSYAGAQILVPLNLYASMPITGDTLFVPLGSPLGIRAVNMADIDPAATFLLGADTWQCFPAFAKSVATTVGQGGAGWAAAESSYLVGYAYPRD